MFSDNNFYADVSYSGHTRVQYMGNWVTQFHQKNCHYSNVCVCERILVEAVHRYYLIFMHCV